MSSVDQELDQLSTSFSQSIGIGGDNSSKLNSEPSKIGNSQYQDSSNAAGPLDNQNSSNSSSSGIISSESEDLPGCTPSSLRNTNSSNDSTVDPHIINHTFDFDYSSRSSAVLDEEYVMNHKERGLCLIFNHEEFEHVSPRSGTEHDAYCLKRSFDYLGFDVRRFDNLRYTEITETLLKVSRTDHSDADCFCCCILTHGEGEDLHARDQSYAKNNIFDFFTGENCPTLAGKPKIFFIQACRGTKVDHGVQVDCQHDAVHNSVSIVKERQCIPIMADFLISYSTVEHYYSYRNVTTGGWFVQALIPLLEALASDHDLLSILTAVNRKVAINFGPRPGKQIPQIVHTLTKRLILRRKPYSSRRLIQFVHDQHAQPPNNTPPAPPENN